MMYPSSQRGPGRPGCMGRCHQRPRPRLRRTPSPGGSIPQGAGASRPPAQVSAGA